MSPAWSPDPNQVTTDVQKVIGDEHLLDLYPNLKYIQEGNVHPVLLSYYIQLGSELGFIPSIEWTLYDPTYQHAQGARADGRTAKRSDNGWLEEGTHDEIVAVEFQKWDDPGIITEKTLHLVQYSEIAGSIDLVILHYWDEIGHRNELDNVVEKFSGEFMHDGNPYELQADALVIESVFSRTDDSHVSYSYTEVVHTVPGP